MTEHTQSNETFFASEETPEQAALAISAALGFLRQEAERIQMHAVAALIKRASEMAREAAVAMERGG